ncbi:MAG: hypothetical protein NT115_00650, partial [Proteobacteria bacterium]|nr:hypothetical protein [Pseudomonadota bacterium]
MSIGHDDFKRLRVPIALCLVLIAAGAAALASAENAIERAEKEQVAVRTAKLAAQDRVAKATDEEREIRENLAQFQRLVEWGIIGEEKRLDWVESIAQIRQQRKLFKVNYDLEAQKVLDYPGVMPAGNVEFMASRLKVDIPLLHENDLLNFLAD